MMLIVVLIFMFKDGYCEAYPTLETKNVNVGEHVRLTCSRKSAGEIYWMRINSGNSREIFGKTDDVYSHIKVVKDPGIFVLQIIKAKLNDSGVYLCLRKYQENHIYMNLTYLTVKESAVTTSAPTHLQDSVTLYCSAIHHSGNKSCPGNESLLCFRAESNQTLPGLNYSENEEGAFRLNSDGCFDSNYKNSSLSPAQMYHCAVAKHDKETSGGKSNLNTKAENRRDSSNYNTVVCLLTGALAVCLVLIAFLLYLTIKVSKKLNGCSNATVAPQIHESVKGNQESQKLQEDLVIYSAVSTGRKTSKKLTGATTSAEQDVIYTEVNVLGP